MKNVTYLSLGIVILLFAGACQNEHGKNYNDATKVDQDGLAFIKNGIEGGLTEVKVSGLALTNSSNQRVIGFAKMMIDDHTKADSGFMKLEKDKLVDGKDSINSTHHKMISDLSKKTGAAFDKAYIAMMVADHDGAVDLFTKGSQNTSIEVSKFASENLPKIKMHLDSAKAIFSALK
ncbi:MAG: hypothetical protein JWP45_2368 [Mucilaginibacter sp.]|jgi:putative membrane protein|nr:hypothetical protein [Mucilaginibacter sp.]MDB5139578.1 hypothetical protein [Mucilaginibacter sp.]